MLVLAGVGFYCLHMAINQYLVLNRRATRFVLSACLLWAWLAGAQASTADNNWIPGAREEVVRAEAAVEAFNPQSGNPEDLNTPLRRLSVVRLAAQKCVDSRTEVVERLAVADDQPYAAGQRARAGRVDGQDRRRAGGRGAGS